METAIMAIGAVLALTVIVGIVMIKTGRAVWPGEQPRTKRNRVIGCVVVAASLGIAFLCSWLFKAPSLAQSVAFVALAVGVLSTMGPARDTKDPTP